MNFAEFLDEVEKLVDDEKAFWDLCEEHPDHASLFVDLEDQYGELKKVVKDSTANPEEGFFRFLQLVCEKKGKYKE